MGASAAVAGAIAAAALSFPAAADAAFPGRDGLIAFTRSDSSEGGGQIYVVRPDGRGLRQLTHRRSGAGGAAWSPDGRRIAFASERRGRLRIFVKRLGGGVRQITHGDDQFTRPTWSPDGRLIAAVSGYWVHGRLRYHDSIVVMRADGRRKRTVYAGDELSTTAPAWSPDGGSIAFVHTDIGATGADPNIYVVPAAGGEARRITDIGSQTDPDWSPDGGLIAYSWATDLGADAIGVIRPDRTGEARLVDDPAVTEGGPAWAPSGRRLAFSRMGRIWTAAADGSGQRRLTGVRAPFGDFDPSWQPR